MPAPESTRLILIRHAPTDAGGRLAGRRDPPARLPGAEAIARARETLATLVAGPLRLVTSPAQRCRETAEALFPGVAATADPRLWEQDFGAWEGLPPEDLPDLGPLGRDALAAQRPPGGESFLDLVSRTGLALSALTTGGTTVVVAHAGTVRAALGLALAAPEAGLAFEVAPLSATSLLALPGGAWSVGFVNRSLT